MHEWYVLGGVHAMHAALPVQSTPFGRKSRIRQKEDAGGWRGIGSYRGNGVSVRCSAALGVRGCGGALVAGGARTGIRGGEGRCNEVSEDGAGEGPVHLGIRHARAVLRGR